MNADAVTDNWPEVEAASKAALPRPVVLFIQRVRGLPHPESHLIAVLHKVQDVFGYLGAPQLDAVAQLMQIPTAKVTGVATFYHSFRLRPPGRYVISLCMGTACYVKGAAQVAARIRAELGIAAGETTPDGLFSLQEARCLGTCGLAPVMLIENRVHAHLTPDQVPGILDGYRREAAATGAP